MTAKHSAQADAAAAASMPFVVQTSTWGGADGNWSAFDISIGTPPQFFRVFPTTIASESWVPLPQGCEGIMANVSTCPDMRGIEPFQGNKSLGFQLGASTTWRNINVYEITGNGLFDANANGLFGLDTMALQSADSNNASMPGQVIAGVTARSIWLGTLGLSPAQSGFPIRNGTIQSLLVTMKSQNVIPSLSYGYTAGAYYYSPPSPGSLIIGGYDQDRFAPSNVSFPISITKANGPALGLSIQSIIVDDPTSGVTSILPGGQPITAAIDTSESQSWLPQGVCDRFAQTFGLTFDNVTELYLVNATMHAQLLQSNPSITIALTPTNDSTSTVDISLPYAAFDLQAGIPFYNFSTNYFPIRVAPTESEQVLGRAFMQEAYVVVDWERSNFTIGQTIHQNATSDIISIPPVPSPSSSPSLTSGAIAGIALGVVLFVVLVVGGIAFFFLRRRRQRNRLRSLSTTNGSKPTSSHSDDVDRSTEVFGTKDEKARNDATTASEAQSVPVYELNPASIAYELPTTVAELAGDVPIQEADSNPVSTFGSGVSHIGSNTISPLGSGYNSATSTPISLIGRSPFARGGGGADGEPMPFIAPPYGRWGVGQSDKDEKGVKLLKELPPGYDGGGG